MRPAETESDKRELQMLALYSCSARLGWPPHSCVCSAATRCPPPPSNPAIQLCCRCHCFRAVASPDNTSRVQQAQSCSETASLRNPRARARARRRPSPLRSRRRGRSQKHQRQQCWQQRRRRRLRPQRPRPMQVLCPTRRFLRSRCGACGRWVKRSSGRPARLIRTRSACWRRYIRIPGLRMTNVAKRRKISTDP